MCIGAIRRLLITFAFLAMVTPGQANEAYLAGFEVANAHLRTAVSYLRTGNLDLAAIEIESLQAKWAPLGGQVPAGRLKSAIRDVSAAAQAALADVDAGKPEEARKRLLAARQQLYEVHKAEKLTPFADCIWAAIRAGNPLWSYRNPAPDLTNTAVARKIIDVNNGYLAALRACRARAPKVIADDPEYARLMDNADKSLSAIPASVKAGDGGQLYRYLIELRSLDRLLYFRFG